MNIDITVLDYYTHSPVRFMATMPYVDASGFGQVTDEVDSLGDSDEYGHLKIEKRIIRQDSEYYRLELHPIDVSSGIYSSGVPVQMMGIIYTMKLDAKGTNEKTVYLKPYRTFQLRLNNTNCSGLTDSLWVNFPNGAYKQTFQFIGCQDTIYGTGYNIFFNLTQDPTLNVHIKSKKNGVVTTSDQTFNLNPGFDNIVEIDY